MAEPRERGFQMFFQREASMIGADRNSHDPRFYYTLSASMRPFSPDSEVP
jgi:hypothetical protein